MKLFTTSKFGLGINSSGAGETYEAGKSARQYVKMFGSISWSSVQRAAKVLEYSSKIPSVSNRTSLCRTHPDRHLEGMIPPRKLPPGQKVLEKKEMFSQVITDNGFAKT